MAKTNGVQRSRHDRVKIDLQVPAHDAKAAGYVEHTAQIVLTHRGYWPVELIITKASDGSELERQVVAVGEPTGPVHVLLTQEAMGLLLDELKTVRDDVDGAMMRAGYDLSEDGEW